MNPNNNNTELNRIEPNYDLKELKTDVNNFLYTKLPDKTTLNEMEDLSCKINDLIFEFIESFENKI